MEINGANETKPKRVRRNPFRKWSLAEEKLLLEFLMENREFEKPAAQIFYRRFCLEKNVAIDWPQVRAKVRNMRVSYNKAKEWEGSTGAGNMEMSSIESTFLKMCSYFHELKHIFGSRVIEYTLIEDSLGYGSDTAFNFTEITFDETTAAFTPTQEQLPSTSRKGIYSRTAASDIIQMQTEMMEIKRQKMDYEKDLREREVTIMEKTMELKEKELQLKDKEINYQRELKIMEIESQKQLKLSELEMKERVEREQLRLKYSN